jgi:gamma-glutamyl:cysteine ligase YbdK (ATP-grasp superfamily)
MSDLHLFEGHGIELEYMIVDRDTLDVRPIADEVLRKVGGGYEQEVERGPIAWSNELALHVIELKTNGPVPELSGVAAQFQAELSALNELLASFGARILPSAMHPWMDPYRELELWPHQNDVIYQTFHRIFDCGGHGWANLQSMHINLPFSGDEEFGRLHAAIRMILPILPALAASSPVSDGMVRPDLDTRLTVYRHNAASVPSVSGLVIPERVFTRQSYERDILQRIYRDLEPHDPEGVLREEWVNARGAIARFDRMAIEIRVLDVQECPEADLAIASAVTAVIKALVNESLCAQSRQRVFDEYTLSELLVRGIRDADQAVIDHREYLECFGVSSGEKSLRMGELWASLLERVMANEPDCAGALPSLRLILQEGCLARRIRKALGATHCAAGATPERAALHSVYTRLAECLAQGTMFRP